MQKHEVNTPVIGNIYSETSYSIEVIDRPNWDALATKVGRPLDQSIEHLLAIDTNHKGVRQWANEGSPDLAELANAILEQLTRNNLPTDDYTHITLWNVWRATN